MFGGSKGEEREREMEGGERQSINPFVRNTELPMMISMLAMFRMALSPRQHQNLKDTTMGKGRSLQTSPTHLSTTPLRQGIPRSRESQVCSSHLLTPQGNL